VPGDVVLCQRQQDLLWAWVNKSAEADEQWLTPEMLQFPVPAGIPELQRFPMSELRLGQALRGIITDVDHQGVFVDVGAESDGWVHISQISDTKQVDDPQLFVAAEQEVDVWVSQIDDINGKGLYLSMAPKKLKLRPRLPPPADEVRRLALSDVNTWHEGVVSWIKDYGIFVILGDARNGVGVQSLVHVKQIPGNRVDPFKVAEIGQKVKVRVLGSEKDGKMILSMMPDAATFDSFKHIPRTQWLDGLVYDTQDYGFFVEVRPPGGGSVVQGMVHISRMVEDFVRDVKEEVSVGDVVRVRVHEVDTNQRKVSFTTKPLNDDG
ncbi:unnamed protein product, partial [Polarella glacialis]